MLISQQEMRREIDGPTIAQLAPALRSQLIEEAEGRAGCCNRYRIELIGVRAVLRSTDWLQDSCLLLVGVLLFTLIIHVSYKLEPIASMSEGV